MSTATQAVFFLRQQFSTMKVLYSHTQVDNIPFCGIMLLSREDNYKTASRYYGPLKPIQLPRGTICLTLTTMR